eukprot:1366700-Rhodomonas_salina.1
MSHREKKKKKKTRPLLGQIGEVKGLRDGAFSQLRKSARLLALLLVHHHQRHVIELLPPPAKSSVRISNPRLAALGLASKWLYAATVDCMLALYPRASILLLSNIATLRVCAVPRQCEIKDKKPHSWYKSYRKCGFLHLISGRKWASRTKPNHRSPRA